MKSGFESSVPARKPKTQIGRVLTEFTAQSAQTQETEADALPELVQDTAELTVSVPPSEVLPAARQRSAAEPAASTRSPITLHQEAATAAPVSNEWERLATLRERLAAASQPRSIASEPQTTATAVRKLIEDLRARLDAAVRDRADLERSLATTHTALTRTESELEQERKIRSHLEAQADEREKVAVQAVAEAEALASERDLVISELSERHRLEKEQATLLADAEAALNRHRAANEKAARELAELRDLRSAEVADLETRLHAEAAERARFEARCRDLDAQVARLTETAQALEAIKEMVSPKF